MSSRLALLLKVSVLNVIMWEKKLVFWQWLLSLERLNTGLDSLLCWASALQSKADAVGRFHRSCLQGVLFNLNSLVNEGRALNQERRHMNHFKTYWRASEVIPTLVSLAEREHYIPFPGMRFWSMRFIEYILDLWSHFLCSNNLIRSFVFLQYINRLTMKLVKPHSGALSPWKLFVLIWLSLLSPIYHVNINT